MPKLSPDPKEASLLRELENARTQAERDPALQPCVAELERHLR